MRSACSLRGFLISVVQILSVATIASAEPVGLIGGQFDVSPLGSATYSIPISVPPGTAGMEPNCRLPMTVVVPMAY